MNTFSTHSSEQMFPICKLKRKELSSDVVGSTVTHIVNVEAVAGTSAPSTRRVPLDTDHWVGSCLIQTWHLFTLSLFQGLHSCSHSFRETLIGFVMLQRRDFSARWLRVD